MTLFRRSGTPIIEASGTPCADTNFVGQPRLRRRFIHGWVGEIGDFRLILHFAAEMVRDRPTVIAESQYEVVGAGCTGIVFDDLQCPLTLVSRSLYTYNLNFWKTVYFTDKVTKEH